MTTKIYSAIYGCVQVDNTAAETLNIGRMNDPPHTKWSHPYSYDPIILYWSGDKPKASVYTDRMRQWDDAKFTKAYEKNMQKKRWDNAEPKQIEGFLRDYMKDKGLKLHAVIEYCNASNGYPLWRLDYTPTATTRKAD